MKHTILRIVFVSLVANIISACSPEKSDPIAKHSAQEVVNLYSYRKEALIKPLLDRFTEQTNIKVNLVTGKADALFSRLQSEGENSPADVLITVDVGRLHRAKSAGLLQPINSLALMTIPEHLRDSENFWFGLSIRSRSIFYNKQTLSNDSIKDYEDLMKAEFKGKVCIRSSSNIYNQSLMASMIKHLGAERAENWGRGVVNNFARAPQANDTAQLKAVASGECELAVANSYYYGRLLTSDSEVDRELAGKIGIIFPNQNNRGTHINVSGAGITRYAKNKLNAVKLLEFFVSDEAQSFYADSNFEYPVIKDIKINETLLSWGYPFKKDTVALDALGDLNADAVKTFDRAGWR